MRKLTPEQLHQIHQRDETAGVHHSMTPEEADAAANDRAALLQHIAAITQENPNA